MKLFLVRVKDGSDPLAMLPSLHQRLLVTGDENITEFRKAWSKIEDRTRGKSKMSGRIISESMLLVTRWGISDRLRPRRRSKHV